MLSPKKKKAFHLLALNDPPPFLIVHGLSLARLDMEPCNQLIQQIFRVNEERMRQQEAAQVFAVYKMAISYRQEAGEPSIVPG
jgi:hypothetical protein